MQSVYSAWPVARPVVGEIDMHSVVNLATLQTPLAIFFHSKKHPNLIQFLRIVGTAERARGLAVPVHTHLSLALSLCVSSVQRAAAEVQRSQSNKILCCFSNFTCKYSRNHSTAIAFMLCVFDFIRRSRISGFLCRLTYWKGELVL